MKNNFRVIVFTLVLLCAVFSGAMAQINQNANPSSSGITWSQFPLPVGSNATVTFKLGNSGSDPILAEKEQWTINIPMNLVTVGVPSFFPPAGTASTGFYEFSRIVSGTTLVIVLRSHTDIPATTIDAPQDEYLVVYPVTGFAPGGPANATINNGFVSGQAAFVGNARPDDDNASASISVLSALPVQLLSFTGAVTNCQTNLNWKVAQETGFKNYLVEYSPDGRSFSTVRTVNASGSNSSYNATHQATTGTAYYRLKMVDIDGNYAYSKTITLNVNCDNSNIRIYPNPATDVVNLTVSDASSSGKRTAVLSDLAGRILISQSLNTGSNQLNVTSLKAGMYNLNIETSEGTEIHKIVISR